MKQIYVKTVDELREHLENLGIVVGCDQDLMTGQEYTYIEAIGISLDMNFIIDNDCSHEEFMERLEESDSYQYELYCEFYSGNAASTKHIVEFTYDIRYAGGNYILCNFEWTEV